MFNFDEITGMELINITPISLFITCRFLAGRGWSEEQLKGNLGIKTTEDGVKYIVPHRKIRQRVLLQDGIPSVL